jgi:hypothetical protein
MPQLRQKSAAPAKPRQDDSPPRRISAATGHTSFRSEIDKTLAELDKKPTRRRK